MSTIPKTHCGKVAGRPLPYCRCCRFMILIVAEHTKGNFTHLLFMTKERLVYVYYLIWSTENNIRLQQPPRTYPPKPLIKGNSRAFCYFALLCSMCNRHVDGPKLQHHHPHPERHFGFVEEASSICGTSFASSDGCKCVTRWTSPFIPISHTTVFTQYHHSPRRTSVALFGGRYQPFLLKPLYEALLASKHHGS